MAGGGSAPSCTVLGTPVGYRCRVGAPRRNAAAACLCGFDRQRGGMPAQRGRRERRSAATTKRRGAPCRRERAGSSAAGGGGSCALPPDRAAYYCHQIIMMYGDILSFAGGSQKSGEGGEKPTAHKLPLTAQRAACAAPAAAVVRCGSSSSHNKIIIARCAAAGSACYAAVSPPHQRRVSCCRKYQQRRQQCGRCAARCGECTNAARCMHAAAPSLSQQLPHN